ncbi:MAG: SGNH/GDSL hydrolase family protein [Rhodobacteraceae bacterium]|jgi:lysophospholipase L1-like esterase|uniref:SGNH/GDSL hydrolase family protein n=1 Tax=Albidovulum sp. TaxID=1872424 RepID=UPI00265B3BD2|nr:SGNH/GDSL hydrolase family protein [uncultured Defluviimonas sp.]MCC0070925.1 SGNH/GDSL hydrolase family protein [Paracoccaceae bacterium]
MARAAFLTGLLVILVAAVAVFRQAPGPGAPRDRIVPATRPAPEQLSVVAFGTSLTARAVWPAELGARLAGCGFAAASVTVRAQPGAGSAAGRDLVGAEGPGPFNVALIEFAINDADLIDGVSQAASLQNHRAIIRALRSRHPDIAIVLLTTNPVAGLQRLKRPKLMAYGDIYVQLAAGEGVSLFDGTARWLDEGSGGQALVDGLHPEPGLEARLYARPLAETVARIFGRSCTP